MKETRKEEQIMKERDMFNTDDYLKTPESFNAMVENCVREQLEQEKGVISMNKYKRSKVRARQRLVKVAVAVLVICMVAGGGAWAARQYQLAKIVDDSNGPNDLKEEQIQIVEEKQSVSETLPSTLAELRPDLVEELNNAEEPLVTIKEAYFDGSTLYIYGEATDYGEQFADNMGADHVYVNGELRIGGVYRVNENMVLPFEDAKNSIFYGELQLADMSLSGKIKVEVLFTAFAGEVFTSTVVFEVDTLGTTNVTEEQNIEIPNGYVKVFKTSISDTTTYVSYEWHLSGDDAKEKLEQLSKCEVVMQDSLGNEADVVFANKAPNGSRVHVLSPSDVFQDVEDGTWYTYREYYVGGLSSQTDSITIVPYIVNMNEDSNTSKGEDLDFGTFTIKIK